MAIEARLFEGLSDLERKEKARALPITQLKEAVDLLDPRERALFGRLFELVDDRFTNDGRVRENGHMIIPPEMATEVFNQFKGVVGSEDPKEVQEAVAHQWTVNITDRFLKMQARYNPFRAARPVDKSLSNPFIQKIEETRGKDAFCNIGNKTPIGPFGRFEDEFGSSCTNLTKFSSYHEIFTGPHNPYEMTSEHFKSQMSKALRFGQMVHEQDPEAIHFVWGMNFGPKAGASQPHQHSQATVDRGTTHEAEIEEFHEAAVRYRLENPGHEYLDDWLKVHEALGLAKHIEDPDSPEGIWVVMPLTPSKERNVVVIGSKLSDYQVTNKFMDTCWRVIEYMMRDEAAGGEGVMEFNIDFSMPPFGRGREGDYWSDFKPMFSFVDRGVSTTMASDMGFKELKGTIVLATDPKRIAPKLFKAINNPFFSLPTPS